MKKDPFIVAETKANTNGVRPYESYHIHLPTLETNNIVSSLPTMTTQRFNMASDDYSQAIRQEMQKTKRVVYQLQNKQQAVNNGTNNTDYTDPSPFLRQKTLVQWASKKPIL